MDSSIMDSTMHSTTSMNSTSAILPSLSMDSDPYASAILSSLSMDSDPFPTAVKMDSTIMNSTVQSMMSSTIQSSPSMDSTSALQPSPSMDSEMESTPPRPRSMGLISTGSSPPRSLGRISDDGDSCSSSNSINSAWSEDLDQHHSRKMHKLSSSSSDETDTTLPILEDSLHTSMRLSARTVRLVRSQSFPSELLLKNDLYVPPAHAHHALLQKKRRRHKRERKTAAGAVGGMVAGAFVLGPVGVVLGAAVGGFTIRQISKKVEKRSQRKREQRSFRDYATSKSIQWQLNGDAAVFT